MDFQIGKQKPGSWFKWRLEHIQEMERDTSWQGRYHDQEMERMPVRLKMTGKEESGGPGQWNVGAR